MTPDGRGPVPTDRRGGRARRPPGQRPRTVDHLDQAFDAILASSRGTGVIVYWNTAAARLYGWTAAEALGRRADQLLRTTLPVPLDLIEHRITRYGYWEGELSQTTRDGRELLVRSRWANSRTAQGVAEAVVQVNTDVTRRVDAEWARDDSLRLFVSGVRDYAIFLLDPSGVVVSWNEGAERINGYKESEIVGRHFSVFFEPADVAAGKPQRELAAAQLDGHFEEEGWRRRKDGSRFWASVAVTALRDPSGRLRGFGKVTRDVTERHTTEERLREHAEQLAQLEKAKADFLNLASHELRGPLAILKGYVSMFQDRTMAADDLPDVLPVLTTKVQEMDLLVQQMLETARLDEHRMFLRPEPFDLREAAQRVVERLHPLAAPRHRLHLSVPDAPVRAVADIGRIETVIANLADNAIKYWPDGGTVRLTVAAQRGLATVSVEDEGIGIPPEAMGQLFTRFGRIQTKENAHISGTGLGLYLSREIARRHGGDILVEPRSPGSRFTLVLPLA